MGIIKKTINFNNKGQVPIDASDQPTYFERSADTLPIRIWTRKLFMCTKRFLPRLCISLWDYVFLLGDYVFLPETLKYWLVSSRTSLTSQGEGASLTLIGGPSSDRVTIKNALCGRCFTSTSFAPHLFLLGWLKLNLALLLDQLRLA